LGKDDDITTMIRDGIERLVVGGLVDKVRRRREGDDKEEVKSKETKRSVIKG
jgi:hypothetical protein